MTGAPQIIQGAYVKRGRRRRRYAKVNLGPLLFPAMTPGGALLTREFWAGEFPTKQSLLEMGFHEHRPFVLGKTRAEIVREFQDDQPLLMIRSAFVRGFSFALPCREALELIARHTRSIVEVGAGTGFWASLLTRAGVDVVATDGAEPLYARKQVRGLHHPVALQDAAAAVRANPERDLLVVWPSTGPWLADAVEALAPGRLLIMIAEFNPDIGADDRFFDIVEDPDRFDPVEAFRMPRFPGMKDGLVVMRKRHGPHEKPNRLQVHRDHF